MPPSRGYGADGFRYSNACAGSHGPPWFHSLPEHASAQYMEGDKGISDAYPVPRFSKPEFKITAKDGYEIKRVLLNDNDVDKEMILLNNHWFSEEYRKLVSEEVVAVRRSMNMNDIV